jgi:hypothetical protein
MKYIAAGALSVEYILFTGFFGILLFGVRKIFPYKPNQSGK